MKMLIISEAFIIHIIIMFYRFYITYLNKVIFLKIIFELEYKFLYVHYSRSFIYYLPEIHYEISQWIKIFWKILILTLSTYKFLPIHVA